MLGWVKQKATGDRQSVATVTDTAEMQMAGVGTVSERMVSQMAIGSEL